MLDRLLIVLPCHAGDAAQAENLISFCYQLAGREKRGHAMIVCAADVHDEMRMKLKLSGEVTFESCELVGATQSAQVQKYDQCNHLFKNAAAEVQRMYRWPWLWMEPDCVPLVPDWLSQLSDAYKLSPKRFVGPHLQFRTKDEDAMCLARVSIYPHNCAAEMASFCTGGIPFEYASAKHILPRSSKSRLIQHWKYDEATPDKLRGDAVLIHSDKTGKLIEALTKQYEPKRRGRPPKQVVEKEVEALV